MTELEKEVRDVVIDLIDRRELKVNDEYEIEYTEKWLNHWLEEWLEDGYSEEEVQAVKKHFENLEYEGEIEKHYMVGVITYDNGNQEAMWEDEIIDVVMKTKKIG